MSLQPYQFEPASQELIQEDPSTNTWKTKAKLAMFDAQTFHVVNQGLDSTNFHVFEIIIEGEEEGALAYVDVESEHFEKTSVLVGAELISKRKGLKKDGTRKTFS